MSKVDELYNEFLGVERDVAPPKISSGDLREVIETAWQNGETVTVLRRFKADDQTYNPGDQFKPKYKKDIPRLLKLMDPEKSRVRYFIPDNMVTAHKINDGIKDHAESIKNDYKMLTKARNSLRVAQHEKESLLARVKGSEQEIKRAKGQIRKYSKRITDQIEGLDLDELVKELQ